MGVTALGWRGQTGEIAFTSRATGLSEALNLLDTASGRVRRVAQAQSLSGDAGPGCTFASDLAICIESGGSLPPRLSSIAHRNGRKRVLLNPNRELERAIAIPAQTIGWTLGDGRAALGQLLLAQGRNGPAPLLINYYDCRGFLKGGTGDEWPMQLLAQSGIAVLCIQQLPGSAKAPGDNVADYSTGLQAIEAAIDHLAGKGIVDPRRVGISGLSFGSEVAMWAAMKSDRVAAVSIASPTLDAGTYYYFNARPDRDFAAMLKAAWGLKSPEEQPDKWRSLSAADQVGRIDDPVLMQMSEQEYRLNLRFLSRKLAHGRAADLYVFPNERHLLAEPRHRLSAYGRNLDRFRFWLGGEEDPDAGKAAQYEAWRKLRARHCASIASRKSFCSDR
jgi:dipeptidyl aminopeptidase/acylaminoacyl peptidase